MRGPLQGQVAGEDPCRSLIARMPPEDLRLNFQRSVLMKLDSILEKKQEGLVLLQRVVSSLGSSVEDIDNVFPRPWQTIEEMENMCTHLDKDVDLRKKMILYLSSIGGTDLGDTVSKMIRKLFTNKLMSALQHEGQNGKLRFH
ncbi:hypothetical protein HHUSO_G1138 [Huso huso]|uniref:DUF4806 domain-containing protein n=1 Tax=Huso huso TaxID=61971 RepID=A0ABR1ABS4_HUSHU